MIIKGRSPTKRHVSRIQRVALGCLFDRINRDPKIQIKDVHNRNKLADMLTKSTFTRDEWHHLLRLSKFNIMNKSVFSRGDTANRIDESLVMSKRKMQEKQHGEEDTRVVGKSRPVRNLVVFDPQPALSVAEFKFRFTKPRNTGTSCSSLNTTSTVRPVAKDSSGSNAPISQVCQADPDMEGSTERSVAGPHGRATSKNLAYHKIPVSSENRTFVFLFVGFGAPRQGANVLHHVTLDPQSGEGASLWTGVSVHGDHVRLYMTILSNA